MAGRRKAGSENVRSLTKMGGGNSYAITLPKAVIREFGWRERQKLQLTITKRGKSITIKDWSRRAGGKDTETSRSNVKK